MNDVAFLLGVPRSGNTLLAHLLQQHPDIVAPPESWIMLALHAFGRTSTHHPADAQVLAQAMDELLGRVDAHAAFRALADRVYDDYRRGHCKKVTAVYARPEQMRTSFMLRAATAWS